jgi:hypothetical protein
MAQKARQGPLDPGIWSGARTEKRAAPFLVALKRRAPQLKIARPPRKEGL